MQRFSSHRGWTLLVLLAVLCTATWAWAQTPQTITVDGANDFLPINLVDADGEDTEFTPIDLGDAYMTNDAVNLYIGFDHDKDTWTTVQLGIAIDVNTADGGISDPWGRAIEWSLATNKPDYMFYINLDNNWQAGYAWDGSAWVETVTAGTGALGWNTGTGFNELAIMLGTLGVSATDIINYEIWVTQDGGNKGPLDALAGDADQLSSPFFTDWEVESPVPLTSMLSYTVQAAADPDPPVLSDLIPDNYPTEQFFSVYFNEPVDETTANNTANYAITGGTGGPHTVTSATRDATDHSRVHLETSVLNPSGSLYTLTVTGVEDLAGNPIVADGNGNVHDFMLKMVTFRGLFGPFLANQGAGPHAFSIEGSLAPLTWSPLCDTGIMTDTGTDDIWEWSTTFCVTGDAGAGTAEQSFEWKFNYNCGTWEDVGNRVHTLDLANGAADLIEVWWNDEDPSSFTAHDIDVEFFVDMNLVSGFDPLLDVVSINGDVPPLTHDVPSLLNLVDDGSGNDATADDGIYSALVTFPAGARKDVAYKFLLNDTYECDGGSDRSLFLNDELYDTVGGTLGPLTLPVVQYDFCNMIWQAVEVVFAVDFNDTAWEDVVSNLGGTVGLNGTTNHDGSFDWSVPSLNTLLDDGVWPDQTAGDLIYTTSVVFPDSSTQNIEYKFLFNDEYECPSQGNRYVSLDPDNYDDQGNPQVLAVSKFHVCGDFSPVPDTRPLALSLLQNMPNPFNPSTEIRFDVPQAGNGSLRVFNVRGELVRTLRSGAFAQGAGSVVWDGRNEAGLSAGSGVYFYRLEVGNAVASKRMMLLK